jgi:hypothetical protein
MSDVDEFLEIVGTEPRLHYHFYTNSTGQILEVRVDNHKTEKWPVIWKLLDYNWISSAEVRRKKWWKKLDELNELREHVTMGKAKKIVHKCDWL